MPIRFQQEADCRKCDYPDGACYLEGRCRRYFQLDTTAAQQFQVPIYAELDIRSPPEYVSDPLAINCEFRTVTMARPLMPDPRRVDRRTADQWIRLAANEATEHAGICRPAGCVCSNCRQYQEVRRLALELYDKGFYTELSEAWIVAMGEIVGDVGIWRRPSTAPQTSAALEYTQEVPGRIRTDKAVTVSTPTTKESSWVEKRFGVLDV